MEGNHVKLYVERLSEDWRDTLSPLVTNRMKPHNLIHAFKAWSNSC